MDGPLNVEELRHLIDRSGVLRHACDLDLLVFFARHPRSLLSSDSLAAFLGYDLGGIAESLEVLLAAGLLERTQTPAHAARLYVLVVEDATREWLPSLLELAYTRKGRLALREMLAARAGKDRQTRAERKPLSHQAPRRVHRLKPDAIPDVKRNDDPRTEAG